MGTKLQVVAAMAVVGSVAGGGVALAHVPAVQPTAATVSQPSDSTAQTLQSLLEQSARLHDEIEGARQDLAQASADAAAAPQSSTSPQPPAAEPPAQSQAAPANPAPTTASAAPATSAPTAHYGDDDGAEGGGHDGGHGGHESHSTGGGDD